MAMLGEIVVHGEDIRRPLGQRHQSPEAALVAIADSWRNSNLLIGAKRRITGLRLRATDIEWAHGDGPEVAGPLISLILAMTGRKAVHPDLSGAGVAALARRPDPAGQLVPPSMPRRSCISRRAAGVGRAWGRRGPALLASC